MELRHYAARIAAGVLAALLVTTPITVQAAESEGAGNDISYSYSTGTGTTGSTAGISSKTWTQLSDNTWTMDVDGDGTIDVTLEEIINSDGEQEWTYTFNVADDETAYYVYEEMTKNGALPLKTGYTSEGSDNKTAIPQDPGQADSETKAYTIKNKMDHDENPGYGSLTLHKTVTNPASMQNPDQEFLFTITLSGETDALKKAIEGTKVFGETVFKDGAATVALKHNASVTITDIPAGMTYTIVETVPDDYTNTNRSGDTGAIVKDAESKAEFENTTSYTTPTRDFTSFQLAKKVEVTDSEGVSEDTEYTFHVMFEGLIEYDKITATIVGAEGTDPGESVEPTEPAEPATEIVAEAVADATGVATMQVTLKDGQTVRFTGIPVGAKYQVEEAAGDYTPSYEITDANGKGTIASSNGAGEKGSSLSTGKETADSDEDVTVTYTNTIIRVQNLILEKKSLKLNDQKEYVDDTEDTTQYGVTVSFKGLAAGYRIKTTSGVLIADNDGEIETTLLIERNQQITFYNIPVGTTYQFTESANAKVGSYEITGDPLTAVKNKEFNYTVQKPISTETEKVDPGENATVTFTNKTPGTAHLQVIKYAGTSEDPGDKLAGAEFALYKADGTPVNYTKDGGGKESNIIVIGEKGESEVLESDLFVVGSYYLVETKAPDGYMVNGEHLTFEIKDEHLGQTLQINAYDDALIVLPVTGGEGRYGIYILAIILAGVAAAAVEIKVIRNLRF